MHIVERGRVADQLPKRPAAVVTGVQPPHSAEAPARIERLAVFSPITAGGTGLPAYERWLGRPVRAVADNVDETQGWTEIVQSSAFLARCYSNSALDLVIAIPMLPRRGGGSLRRGAAGDYDEYFHAIGRELASKGLTRCVIRLGWEFNGRWMPWFAGDDPASFVQFWRRLVDILRSHSEAFRFDWCATLGRKDMDTDVAWPGADYVDIIGADVYDQWWVPGSRGDFEARWNTEYLWAPFGLQWQITFAREARKSIGFAEWGVQPVSALSGHGCGDDPDFVVNMARWFDAAGGMLAYQAYFERVDIALSGGRFPRSAKVFRRLFGTR